MYPRAVVVVGGIMLLLGGIGGFVAADGSFDASLSPSVDTPPRDIEFNGKTYDISGIGRIDPGDTITADVTAPENTDYNVHLYNAEKDIVDSTSHTGDDTTSFDTSYAGDTYPAGSYAVVVESDGIFEDIAPLVLSAYHISVDAPSTLVRTENESVSATLEPVDGDVTIHDVVLVIGNDADEHRLSMTETSDGTYTATVDGDALPVGTYSLYVVVQGPDDAFGRQELIGVSDATTFSITDPTPTPTQSPTPTSTPTPTDESSSGGPPAGGSGSTATPTATPMMTASPTPTLTPTPTGTPTASPTRTPSPSSPRSPTASPTPTPSPTETPTPISTTITATTDDPGDDAITPNPTETTSSPTTTPGQHLGSAIPFLAACVFLLLFGRRRT